MDRFEKINHLDWLIDHYKIAPHHLKSSYIECNTLDMDLNTDLYRIMSLERLKHTLQTNSLSMAKPKTWEDPYETFLMNYKARMKDGTIVGFQPIREKIYCLCWSLREECEGLWKAHSYSSKNRDLKFAKIKIHANKLMNYFYDTNNLFHYISYFIGRVTYVELDFIISLLKEGIGSYYNSIYSSYMAIIHSLLLKRKVFEYEDEVRLIFYAQDRDDIDKSSIINKWDLSSNYFSFKIDSNDLIEEIVLHPYLKEEECIEIEQEIRTLGYKGKISHSNLYSKEDVIYDY